MDLKTWREYRGLTRREVAERSGINIRSLQDYEQGHKEIKSAKGETLYRLSMVLNCTMEELIESSVDQVKQKEIPEDGFPGRLKKSRVSPELTEDGIQKSLIFSPTYKVYGRWKFRDDDCTLSFAYDGKVIEMPFIAEFTPDTIPWLRIAAMMKINSFIRNEEFKKKLPELEEGLDEW